MNAEVGHEREPVSGGPGPGWVVAAAFIGPGTVTTATLAGANFGTALLWALLFSTVATMVLQEMAARLGLVTGKGLGEAVRARFQGRSRVLAVGLVVAAIGIGNAAYQTGNLLGGALGLQGALGGDSRLWAALIGLTGGLLLYKGSYALLERVMVVLVGVMALAFLVTAIVVLPSLGLDVLKGMFVPSLPSGSVVLAIGLVGTTVVPYNLFLHASAVSEKWSGVEHLGRARRDLILSIGIGGLVSSAILITSAGTMFGTGTEVTGAADMAVQLEPVLGGWASAFFAAGLFAAGMTSAVTAPLAAAYATAGAVGWEMDLQAPRVRAVWMSVLGIGLVFAVAGLQPVPAIVFAQAMNGVLLPAIAVFLLLAVNDRVRMGSLANRGASNLLGFAVVAVAVVLGVRALILVAGRLGL